MRTSPPLAPNTLPSLGTLAPLLPMAVPYRPYDQERANDADVGDEVEGAEGTGGGGLFRGGRVQVVEVEGYVDEYDDFQTRIFDFLVLEKE